ncbi:MAG: hypothetical protein WKF77_13150 [Planctomycetaceae bacterium]
MESWKQKRQSSIRRGYEHSATVTAVARVPLTAKKEDYTIVVDLELGASRNAFRIRRMRLITVRPYVAIHALSRICGRCETPRPQVKVFTLTPGAKVTRLERCQE